MWTGILSRPTFRAMNNSGGGSQEPDSSAPPGDRVDDRREDADIGTSSEDYARRFTGAVVRWFIETQTRITLGFLGALPVGASFLDVGVGHAQITPLLLDAGYEVTVAGRAPPCGARLQPWL